MTDPKPEMPAEIWLSDDGGVRFRKHSGNFDNNGELNGAVRYIKFDLFTALEDQLEDAHQRNDILRSEYEKRIAAIEKPAETTQGERAEALEIAENLFADFIKQRVVGGDYEEKALETIRRALSSPPAKPDPVDGLAEALKWLNAAVKTGLTQRPPCPPCVLDAANAYLRMMEGQSNG